jgi:hypothetical protein
MSFTIFHPKILAFASIGIAVIYLHTQRSELRGGLGSLKSFGGVKLAYDAETSTTTGVSGRLFEGRKVRTFDTVQLQKITAIPLKITPDCKLWAVVTTIHSPTKSIHKVVEQPQICTVIVADKKTPTEEYLDLEREKKSVTFLSVQKQNAMTMEIHNELPWNHFGRKNLASDTKVLKKEMHRSCCSTQVLFLCEGWCWMGVFVITLYFKPVRGWIQ